MTLQGDLTTLDLTSLFQSLDGAAKTGVLTVRDGDEETRLYFEKGKLTLLSHGRRTPLLEFLVASGHVSEEAIDKARKSRKRGQPLGAALIDLGEIEAATLTELATVRLTDDACEVLATGASTFEFAPIEGAPPGFDSEERALALGLEIGPLLLESARRADHWSMIREQLPSDSMHYRLAKPPRELADPDQARVLSQLTKLLDGSRNVREVVAQFPTKRFEAYQLLADLSRSQTIRPVAVADLNAQVLELARRDRKRAMALLERGLEQNPHHLELLRTKALLAQRMGQKETACEALKLVSHLSLECSRIDDARAALDRLKALDPDDPYAWEKSLELAVEEERREDAVVDGKALAALYRKLGLHKKVIVVYERLTRLMGHKWDLVRELARARAAAGEPDAAVKGLEKHAASLIELESYPAAVKVYEEILGISPNRTKAKETLEVLKTGALAQKRAEQRALTRRILLCLFVFIVAPWIVTEALSRMAFIDASRAVVRERLLEVGRYSDAREHYEAVRAKYPWTTTALFELDPLVRELDARIGDTQK